MTIKIPGHTLLDVGDDLTEVLKRDWDASNTDNNVPRIEFVNDIKRARFHHQDDMVIITSLQEFDYPASLQYNWENVAYTATIMTLTGDSREHSVKQKEEVRRILHDNRIEPFEGIRDTESGNIWLWIRRITDNVHRKRNFWVWSFDIEVKHRYRAVRT